MFRKVVFFFLIFVVDYAISMEIPIFDADGDAHNQGVGGVVLFDADEDAVNQPDEDAGDLRDDDFGDEAPDQAYVENGDEVGAQAGGDAGGTEATEGITEAIPETIATTEATIATTASTTPFVPIEPSNDCGPQSCRSNGELVCGEWNYKHQAFSDLCDLKAHNCETGDKYEQVDISLCPLITYTYCRDTEDYVCCTADNENFIVFKNFCEYAKFQSTSRKVYWTTPLSNCFHLPEMPIEKCYESAEMTTGEVCGFDGDKTYKFFSDLFELTQEKCYENGDWRKVSMIYC